MSKSIGKRESMSGGREADQLLDRRLTMIGDGGDLANRLMRMKSVCRKCGAQIVFEAGAGLAKEKGINDKVVMCNKCRSVYEVSISFASMSLETDVTEQYSSQLTTQFGRGQRSEARETPSLESLEGKPGFLMSAADKIVIRRLREEKARQQKERKEREERRELEARQQKEREKQWQEWRATGCCEECGEKLRVINKLFGYRRCAKHRRT